MSEPIANFIGNGVSTSFALGFEVLLQGDLRVTVDGAAKTAPGDFTVLNLGDPAGAVLLMGVAPGSGEAVAARRETALVRDVQYQQDGDLLAATVNKDFRRLWHVVQELDARPAGDGDGGGAVAPDLTPPPTVFGLTATAGLSDITISWAQATYTQGNGPGATRIYLALRSIGDPQPVFADAALVASPAFPLTTITMPVGLSVRAHVWAKWESADGGVSASPAGGTNGFVVTTSGDIAGLKALLDDEITESMLYATLRARIDLIENYAPGSVNGRLIAETMARSDALILEAINRNAAITTERTLRELADVSLAEQITLITAGAGEQFDYDAIWYFDTGVEAWTGNGTPTATNSLIRPATSADAYIDSPAGLGVDAVAYSMVKLRLKRTGAPAWAAYVKWKTAAGAYSAPVALTEPTWDGGFGVCSVHVTWAGTIDQLRLGFGAVDGGNYFECDWFAVGRPAPGAAAAALADEIAARVTGDAAEASARTTLATQLRGGYGGTDIADVASGLLASEKTARSTADTALAASATALAATVSANNSAATAAIAAEASARASAVSAVAADVSTLSATVSSNNSTLTAAVATEASARASADGHMAATYNVRTQLTQDGRTVMGGFGIMGTSGGSAGATIDFGVLANKFWIGAPAGTPGVADVLPFVVQTTPFTENGVTRPAGVYIDALMVKNLNALVATIVELIATTVRSGQTAFNTGVGYFIGKEDGTPAFSIGDPSGAHMTYHNGVLSVVANSITKVGAGVVDGFFGTVFAQSFGANTAAAALSLLSDGQIQKTVGVTTTIIGNWYSPTTPGIGAQFNVLATVIGDTLNAGTINSVVGLGSTQSWSLQSPGGSNATKSATLTWRVNRVSSGAVEGRGSGVIETANEP